MNKKCILVFLKKWSISNRLFSPIIQKLPIISQNPLFAAEEKKLLLFLFISEIEAGRVWPHSNIYLGHSPSNCDHSRWPSRAASSQVAKRAGPPLASHLKLFYANQYRKFTLGFTPGVSSHLTCLRYKRISVSVTCSYYHPNLENL